MATATSYSSNDLNTILQTSINIRIDPETVSSITSQLPFLPVPNALNLRTISAKNLKPGFIFRSGRLSHLSSEAVEAFTDKYNITTIFDLRSASEVKRRPDPKVEGVKIVLVDWEQTFQSLPETSGDKTIEGGKRET
jgi:hypothetical protein